MKHKFIFFIILLFSGLLTGLLFYFNRRQPENNRARQENNRYVETAFARNTPGTTDLTIDGLVEARKLVNVTFEVGGTLEKGDVSLEAGTKFRKGQLLCKINNREAFAVLSREKARLSALVLQILPEIEMSFPDEKNKWARFAEELRPAVLLPELPAFHSTDERRLMAGKGVLADFTELQLAEARMIHYFYVAPFDGIVLSVSEQPGNTIHAGKRVARIGTEDAYRIAADVPRDCLETFGLGKEISILLPDGTKAGRASFAARAAIMDTAPTRYYFDANWTKKHRLFHGMSVRLSAVHRNFEKTCKVPASAVDRDRIQIVQNGRLVTRRITVAAKKGDTLLVKGLENGDAYAVRYDLHPDPSLRYHPKLR